jgi:hypothetical protein
MARLCVAVGLVWLLLAARSLAADPVVMTAQGTVDKADKDSLTVRPRGSDGKFGKSLVLKVTGTTTISTLVPQVRAGKQVLTQNKTDAKDLQPKQAISVIYAQVANENVLLAAVVHPADGK